MRLPLCIILGVAIGCGLGLEACGDNSGNEVPLGPNCDAWHQWGNDASHAGASCVRGQPLHSTLADMVYDPYFESEFVDARGELIVHYQAPLIDGDDLYMLTKKGTYTRCNLGSAGPSCNDPDELYRLNSQIWSEQHFTVSQGGTLALHWTFDSDWKPEPQAGFEPMFQPALAGSLLVLPGAGGALWEVDAQSGQVVRHVQPFGTVINPDLYVAGGLAVGQDNTIYYNALQLDHDQPYSMPSQAWLVAVSPDGSVQTADYQTLVRGAPRPTDLCAGSYDFFATPQPWPLMNADGTLALPPSAPCGPQRPGINTTPAVGADGSIFIVSRAHFNSRYAYVTAVDEHLATRWATSLRDYLHDGCGVATPADGIDGTDTANQRHCRAGTPTGLEPDTGLLPAGSVEDDSSSSPVALPDGGVLYGAYTRYNDFRGNLFQLSRSGQITGSYDFGWDSTPAVFGGAGDYKIVIKDNHYEFDQKGVPVGPYFITELDSSMNVRWKFQNTNTKSCVRSFDGTIGCTEDHPNGFEWCINAPAVDRDGTVYANSEDGNAYAIAAGGTLRDSFFLELSLGAAYTPTALDHAGRVYALNSGHLVILGGK